MSSDQAKAYHSITIGDKNTWDDWHLIPTSRPLVPPPEVKTHIVEIPGSNEIIDLTEALAGRPAYGNRTGSWKFYVINSGQLVPNSSYGEWYERYSTIMDYLHGLEHEAILDDDQAYYYIGRFSVESWSSQKGNSVLTINYNVKPYKYDVYGANANWLWDPFNFETGIIRNYKNLVVKGSQTIKYVSTGVTISVPTITCSVSGMTVTFDGTTYSLNKGANTMNGMHFAEGENRLVFTGTGHVSIEATGGIL